MSKTHDPAALTDEEEAAIQAQIAADPDAPEATDEQLRQARPFAEVFPDLVASLKRSEREPRRQATSVGLDPDVAEKFRRTGEGWETRINDVLRQAKV